jgi:hypothetical protein
MEKYTVSGGPLSVGSGELLALTAAQLATRAHNVEVLAEADKKGLTKVKAIAGLVFKEGEEIHLDRVPKGNGLPATEAPAKGKAKASKADQVVDVDAIRAEGVKAGRAEMLAEIERRNELFEAAARAEEAVTVAKAAHEAEADPEKRKPLQLALTKAQEDLDAAEKVVADLPELKA